MSDLEVMILIHEAVLGEMQAREQRILREMRRLQEDLDQLGNDIRAKKFEIAAARDRLLQRCV